MAARQDKPFRTGCVTVKTGAKHENDIPTIHCHPWHVLSRPFYLHTHMLDACVQMCIYIHICVYVYVYVYMHICLQYTRQHRHRPRPFPGKWVSSLPPQAGRGERLSSVPRLLLGWRSLAWKPLVIVEGPTVQGQECGLPLLWYCLKILACKR